MRCTSLAELRPRASDSVPFNLLSLHVGVLRNVMLYKLLIGALIVVSGDALKIGAGTAASRRAVLLGACMPLGASPAFAALKQASDGEVYKRADMGQLNAARVIERAKKGTLIDGSSASCAELNRIIAVDNEALEFEKDKLDAIEAYGTGEEKVKQTKIVDEAEQAIFKQIQKLKLLRVSKGCTNEGMEFNTTPRNSFDY